MVLKSLNSPIFQGGDEWKGSVQSPMEGMEGDRIRNRSSVASPWNRQEKSLFLSALSGWKEDAMIPTDPRRELILILHRTHSGLLRVSAYLHIWR